MFTRQSLTLSATVYQSFYTAAAGKDPDESDESEPKQ